MSRRARLFLLVVPILTSGWLLAARSQEPEPERTDPLEVVRFLAGSWKGEGLSFGKPQVNEQTFTPMFDGTFLHGETESVTQADEEGGEGDHHRDFSVFSFDADQQRLMLRGFYSEGFVNTYALKETTDEGELVFESLTTESAGGMRARLRILPRGNDAYRTALDLASGERPWSNCQSTEMKRLR